MAFSKTCRNCFLFLLSEAFGLSINSIFRFLLGDVNFLSIATLKTKLCFVVDLPDCYATRFVGIFYYILDWVHFISSTWYHQFQEFFHFCTFKSFIYTFLSEWLIQFWGLYIWILFNVVEKQDLEMRNDWLLYFLTRFHLLFNPLCSF